MHVLPLPFGLALALLPRREANRIRPVRPAERNVELRSINAIREGVYVASRRHVV